jgi:hypothetical protein
MRKAYKPWRTYSGALPLIPSSGLFKTPTPLIETLFPGIVLLNRPEDVGYPFSLSQVLYIKVLHIVTIQVSLQKK